MTDAGIISPAAQLQAAVEEDAADLYCSSQSQLFRAGNEKQESMAGEDGLVQRKAQDLSHQLVWMVLMGEANPCLFFGWGKVWLLDAPSWCPNLESTWEQMAEDELRTEQIPSALSVRELAGGGAPCTCAQ